MKSVLSIALIFSNVVLLLSQNFIESSFELKETMYFKKGYKIDGSDKIAGELISIKLNQAMNSKTGLKSEVFFKPKGTSNIPSGVAALYVEDEGYYIIDTKDIDKIIIKLKMKSRNERGTMRVHNLSKVIYSDKVQNEYSAKQDFDRIIDNAMQELYQMDKKPFFKWYHTVLITGFIGYYIYEILYKSSFYGNP